MRNIFLLLIFSLFFIGCNTTENKGVTITCAVKNSNQEFVNLNYAPRMRGIFNYDGFNSIGSFLNPKGDLTLHSDKITDAANYVLEFKNKGIQLVLFEGDNLKLDFDIDNPEASLFATGIGAGKINTLNLPQFGYNKFNLEAEQRLEELNDQVLTVISEQQSLLKSIFLRKSNDEIVLSAQNKNEIVRIINSTPLTKREYSFIGDRINFQKYSLCANFLTKLSNREVLDTVEINFENDLFKCFNIEEYKKLKHINDWHLANSLESILKIEYLRELVNQKGIKVTYGNWNTFFSDSNYTNWTSAFLKTNFNKDVYNKYYSDLSAWLMTLGYDYELLYKRIDTLKTSKYKLKLDSFKNLLENGLADEEYGLNANELTLNEKKFDKLLGSFEGKPLLITFWSAQFAGASIVNNLQAIKLFEEANKEKVNLLHICIDSEVNKKIWAARIIDNSWKSKHYFLPIENNDSILNKFSNKKISAFCDGGATYAFIDKSGQIHNEINFPFYNSVSEIDKMIQ